MEGDVVMILGLPPILGFLPLVLYIILMMKGKDMNLSVLICVILGAVMTGESVRRFWYRSSEFSQFFLVADRLYHRPWLRSGRSPDQDESRS